MMKHLFFVLFMFVTACTPSLPNPANVQFVTAIPTVDGNSLTTLCNTADLGAKDWIATIQALEALDKSAQQCPDQIAIPSRLYNAYLAYGTFLEQNQRLEEALVQYQKANDTDKLGTEALARLDRLYQLTPTVTSDCPNNATEILSNIPAYEPTRGVFIRINGAQFAKGDETFTIEGLNYYPRDTPFGRFLTETQLTVLQAELDIITEAGFNTLRIFLRYEDLFVCNGAIALPNITNLKRLDKMLQIIGNNGLYAIVVLHHAIDLSTTPLYDSPDYITEQTRFLVKRYQSESAILAWDLRDRGDVDYRTSAVSTDKLLTWLANMAIVVRQTDPNHLITAGWWEDAIATAPLVDFVSFQHYGEYEPLRQKIAILRANTQKPIVLVAIGYSTNALDETTQRNLIYQSLEEMNNNKLGGWMVYMAFDYPTSVTCEAPNCPAPMSDINRYGIWNTSYFPKLTLEAVQRVMSGG